MLLVPLSRSFARYFFATCAGLITTFTALVAQTPSVLDGFDPNVDGTVLALATQADGKVLVAGQFSTIRGFPRSNLARINPDGSLDESFAPNPDKPVRALLIQPDNRIVIGGDFTKLQPQGVGATIDRLRIARLNTDGSIDTAFAAAIDGDLQPQVLALARQPDGSLVVGGNFATVRSTGASSSFNRKNLVRLSSAGAVDLSYDPNPNGQVLAVALHLDGKIVIGGGFTSLWPAGDPQPSTRNRIARLNANGTIDSEFNPNANNGVTSLVVQRDGKIVLGGYFTTLQPLGDDSAATRVHIARLNPTGTLDSEFYPRIEGNVAAIALQADGGILVGGTFSSAWGRGSTEGNRSNVARFNPDGSLDGEFAPTINAQVDAFALQGDGKIVIGGHFTHILPLGASSSTVRNHVGRLNPDGSLDSDFELDAGGRILVSVTQSDGKVVIGGTFTSVGGAPHNYVARLNADGSVDSTYNPDFNGRVYTMAYEASTGKVIVGGAFTTISGDTRNHLARLNPSGTVDSEFNPNIDGQVGVVALQSDGRIVVGGTFANVQPFGASSSTGRANLLRLNNAGTLDTAFDPSPNSSVSAIAIQPDGKILIGGLFSTLTPGFAANTSAAVTARSYVARLNADGAIDTNFHPALNAQVSTIAVQSDNKIIIGGAFTTLVGSDDKLVTVTNSDGTQTNVAPTRNHIARLNADGTLDFTYDPNTNGNVLVSALQSDGKLLIGGSFTTLQPNSRSSWLLRKYAARLNADGTLDETFNLDINEQGGNRVDSIRVQSDGRILIGGSFVSLQPAGTSPRITRRNFARLNANGASVDTGFDPTAGGSTGAVVNGFAVQPDGKVIAVGNFADLGGAKSGNIARFLAEGIADPSFSAILATDGPINTVVVRPNAAPVASQTAGFAWLNANGTLRPTFTTATRLSGEIDAIAVQSDGRILVGGAFANLSNTTGGNLVRFNPDGTLDTSFNPGLDGAVAGIAIQADGRIVVVGAFTSVGGLTRNRIARIDANGSVDVTFDPNASARVNAVVIQSDGLIVIGGAFTTLTPNATTTAVTRNYMARINVDGTVDANYNPAPNFNVNALGIQAVDGKVIAGGSFTSVSPNGAATATTRNSLARFNTDGSLDQNFNPNASSPVNALVVLSNGQMVVGGSFTSLAPNGGSTVARNNIARINSDGAVDSNFSPAVDAAVTSLAVDLNGAVLAGGIFNTAQSSGSDTQVSRNHLVRFGADGALDLNFNPDVNGAVTAILPRPDGSVMVGGAFTELQLNGSIVVGGNFASIGGIPARNLASLNDDGSVNTTFQPRPDGIVNAMLVQPDGKVIVGGAFTNLAGVARNRLARFNADGTLDTSFNPNAGGEVLSLAFQPDGKVLVGGSFTTIGGQARANLARISADGSFDATFTATTTGAVSGLAVQPDGRILILSAGSGVRHVLSRIAANGSVDSSFTPVNGGSDVIRAFTLQADGRIIVSGAFSTIAGASVARLARLNSNGSIDPTYNPAPNGIVTAVALQQDGRLMIGGGFNNVGGQQRVGIARVAATSAGTQVLGVTSNRSAVIWTRSGTTGEVAAVTFEQSLDFTNWTTLGNGTRVANGSDWQLTGLNLPASGLFYIRARGLTPSSAGTSSGVFEQVREFNYTNPIAPLVASADPIPTTSRSPAMTFDPVTGIARAALLIGPGGDTIEIMAAQASAVSGTARLANLSTRGRVTSDNPLILGFAITGTDARRVLVRAAGPALAGFGVADALPATRLQVYNATGGLLTSNQGWADAAELAQTAVATGAFPFQAGSADSAALLTLQPGNYTIQIVDPRGSGGVALAEIYDADTGTGSRLVNVSSRGAAGNGSAALISGFVIAGGSAVDRVLLRGIGPGLTKFGTTGVTDPAIHLYDGQGRSLGGNDNWVSGVTDVSAAAASSGAFSLDADSKDAAVLATLPAGAYTIQVTAGSAGTALLEIYEVR